MIKKCIFIICLTLSIGSCDDTKDKAQTLVEEARTALDEQRYDDVLTTIDTLRSRYPTAIEARKEALVLWQKAELLRTQKELAGIDSLLLQAEQEYARQKALADQLKETDPTAWREHNRAANFQKAYLDSLKNRFDVACAKIKYIHRKQKEN